MLRDRLADRLRRLFITDIAALAESDFADIGVKAVLLRIAIPVSFIGTYGVFIPLAGKYALPTNSFKAVANAADAGEEIDKTKRIVGMMARRNR